MLNMLLKFFPTRNDKEIKKYITKVNIINQLEEKYKNMSDEELKSSFQNIKNEVIEKKRTLNDILYDSFAITRESSKRVLGLRHFDVQLIGGMVLHDGKIAEMKTGEGKTLVATLCVILNAISNKGVHIVTVNDYLASRDSKELEPLYDFLGFTVGSILSTMEDERLRQEQYNCDITYGTNNEFGFDFLRDNMKYKLEDKAQNNHYFAIVDEVDSILIDEARTPLIISGPTDYQNNNYDKSNEIALKLEKGRRIEPNKIDQEVIIEGDFIVDEKNKSVLLTENGIKKSEKMFNVDNLYSIQNATLSHQLDQALKANFIFIKDVDYVVKDNQIVIVDEFTGRLSIGRRFGDGLHQAIESKENVTIQDESQTLADITFQNYFRMYKKLSGMTGTAQTEATEFSEIYSLDVISIPTNVPIQREDKNDLIYKSEKEKFNAVCQKIKKYYQKGQPVLVGTASIEKSEYLHKLLTKEKIPHKVLNAKQHEKEGIIISNAGQKKSVTIATNMAGRGVDIKVTQDILDVGGLAIIGTERHESRRIDNQLRGRAGRQGDIGETQFFLSLEDSLLRIFGSDKIKSIMERLGIEDGEHIESKIVTRSVENAQKKVETMHFESRKHLLEYDDVSNKQRIVIYEFRKNLLDKNFDISSKIYQNIDEYISNLILRNDILETTSEEDYDYDILISNLKEELHIVVNNNEIKSSSLEELKNKLKDILYNIYNKKMQLIDTKYKNEIERILYLQIIDKAWRDHLYSMDTLKAGIGLRSYNQKDPLVEYKKESYNMFLDLISSIKLEIVKILFNIKLKEEKENEDVLNNIVSSMEDTNSNNSTNLNSTISPMQKKIARNEPCPCGSGKKYKQCCGKSGPKRGVLANS
jgi:preprotein translocase subunit SecA